MLYHIRKGRVIKYFTAGDSILFFNVIRSFVCNRWAYCISGWLYTYATGDIVVDSRCYVNSAGFALCTNSGKLLIAITQTRVRAYAYLFLLVWILFLIAEIYLHKYNYIFRFSLYFYIFRRNTNVLETENVPDVV